MLKDIGAVGTEVGSKLRKALLHIGVGIGVAVGFSGAAWALVDSPTSEPTESTMVADAWTQSQTELAKRPVRIYGNNGSWGSYLGVKYKSGETTWQWSGNQCSNAYIEIRSDKFKDIKTIIWRQGAWDGYYQAKNYEVHFEAGTVLSMHVNERGVEALRQRTPQELYTSVLRYVDLVSPGCQNWATQTWLGGWPETYTELTGLLATPYLQEGMPQLMYEKIQYWWREAKNHAGILIDPD